MGVGSWSVCVAIVTWVRPSERCLRCTVDWRLSRMSAVNKHGGVLKGYFLSLWLQVLVDLPRQCKDHVQIFFISFCVAQVSSSSWSIATLGRILYKSSFLVFPQSDCIVVPDLR